VQQDWNRAVSARLQKAGAEVVARGSESGISGQFTAKVGFSVAADGMITDVKIAGSSGNAAVDQLAVQIPTLASPMPPFTPDMTPDAKAVVAPLQLNFEAPQTGDTTQP
jgi:protein TonB